MIRDATPADFPRIRELLIRANDAPYDISAVAGEKCLGAGYWGVPRVRIHEHGVAVTCGRFLRLLAVEREHRGRGIGTALLRDSGASVIAAEPGNYFTPGVVEGGWLERRGFTVTARTTNMHVSIRDGFGAPLSSAALFGRAADPPTHPKSAAEDSGAPKVVPPSSILPFIEREFGKIWAFEAARATAALYLEDIGFAVIEANNRGLGTFGPFGVAKAHRGKGHGSILVRAALGELARIGYERAIIPWTDAIDFYRKACGAEPAHTFLTYTSRP